VSQRLASTVPFAPPAPRVVVASRIAAEDARFWLVDAHGGRHPVGIHGRVGRDAEACQLIVVHDSVSRQHAELSAVDGCCYVRDLGSTNGTYLDGRRQAPRAAAPMSNGQLLLLGNVRFTVSTAALLPCLRLEGATVSLGPERVSLAASEAACLARLAARRADDLGQPEPHRGFVRAAELVPLLEDGRVPELIGRLGRALGKLGAGDLLEHRAGFGYRLLADLGPR
jgi:hypothetical protein